MHLEDDDANDLKSWVVGRLQNISDADSDVLADYVLALLKTDTPDAQLKVDVSENLEDFLKSNTSDFVNEVFKALESRSYKPGYNPVTSHQISAAIPAPETGFPTHQKQQPQASRKRTYNDAGIDGPDPNPQSGSRGERQFKQARGRGGRGGRGANLDSRGGGHFQGNGYQNHPFSGSPSTGIPQGFPPMPTMPGMPQFDPNDPMAAILAMQAMGLPPLPGMEGLLTQQNNGSPSPGFQRKGGKGICRDYVNKGYCTRGDACPFQHTNPVVMPGQQDEYDPKDSVMILDSLSPRARTNGLHFGDQSPSEGNSGEFRGRGRGRGRGGTDRGGFRKPGRADFSHAGPNHDRSITTIVVEQIPEEKFSEEAVREFFSEFGSMEEVTMQPYKRLAIVKYSDYSAARAAYDSPKVIFDNRFVKVYWYKPGSVPTPPTGPIPSSRPTNDDTPMKEPSPPFDMEAFTAAQATAQAKIDARKSAVAAMTSKREALEKQKADLASKQAAEKQKLLDRLAAKGQPIDSTTTTTILDASMADSPPLNSATTPKEGDSAHTRMLRAKVAELEAEARSLGLPDSALSDSTPTWTPRGRGRGRGARGSYRGWEGFDPAYRGGGRGGGRGSFVPGRGSAGGGKYNLDLRTKRVAVTLVPTPESDGDQQGWTPDRDEALRQHLLGVGEFEDIQPEEGKAETLVIQFKERGVAEGFFYGVKGRKGEVPGLEPGVKVEVAWVNMPPALGSKSVNGGEANGNGVGVGGGDENGGGEEGRGVRGARRGDVGVGEGDYDVAEDEEDEDGRWMS